LLDVYVFEPHYGDSITAIVNPTCTENNELSCSNNSLSVPVLNEEVPESPSLKTTDGGGVRAEEVDTCSAVRGQFDGRAAVHHCHPVKSVQFALVRGTAKSASAVCQWVRDTTGHMAGKPSHHGYCDSPVWLSARRVHGGGSHTQWTLQFNRRLPRAQYTIYARAVTTDGFASAQFDAAHHSLVSISARQCVARKLCR
jgi:hypothetical protein